jgi:hypothetical protein
MTQNENTILYGVLASVVLVGIVGLYVASITPSPIYIQNIKTINPTTYQTTNTQPQSLLSKINPFRVFGQGLLGMSSTRNGSAEINLSTTLDVRMPKSTISCTASINQDSDGVDLYTCADQPTINGSITCEGGNKTTFTEGDCINSSTGYTLNGSFMVENHGSYGQLNVTLLNITIGSLTRTSIFLNVTLYNYTGNVSGLNHTESKQHGCRGGNWSAEGQKAFNNSLGNSCNRCYIKGQSSPAECTIGLSGNSASANATTTVCRNFSTSGVGVCQCYGIHVTNASDVHLLKSGQQLAFTVRSTVDTITTPAC